MIEVFYACYTVTMEQVEFDFDVKSTYTLYAQPEKNGFFGLRQLQRFSSNIVEPYLRAQAQETLIFDFSLIKVWDIAAILWLVVSLHHYKKTGLSFLIRLPEGKLAQKSEDEILFDKSADILRRWKLNDALSNIVSDPTSILVPEQQNYFPLDGPIKYYKERKVTLGNGLVESLISRRLLNIRNLSDPKFFGSEIISSKNITECVADFQSAKIGDILSTQCDISKRDADLFSDHLLTEALLNVLEHTEASLGMMAISVMGASKELILSVVDNGSSIPSTIYSEYYRGKMQYEELKSEKYSRYDLSCNNKIDIIDYATQPGVTRKKGEEALHGGMGLSYIKKDTIDTFNGKLLVISDGVVVRYDKNFIDRPYGESYDHSWSGNLIRISIPLIEKKNIKD